MSELPESIDLTALRSRLSDFANAREWGQFHTPKNLAMAVAVEAGELIELFQWKSPRQALHLDSQTRALVGEELADVLIYCVRLADVLGLSLSEEIEAKLLLNERRYPVKESRGNATKYARRTT